MRYLINRLLSSGCLILLALSFMLAGPPTAHAQMGHVLNGVGPLDQSWSGAGMANPQDGLTALHWNPATLTNFDGTTLDLSLQLMFPTTDLSSSIDRDALGPGVPPAPLAGVSSSDAGPFPIPAAGIIHRPAGTRWGFGLSAFGVGGFGVDYEGANPTAPGSNPILFPQQAGGFGALNSSFALFQVSPTVAYQLTETLSFGLAPTFNLGMLEVNPFPGAAPDQNGYPDGPQSSALGIGLQAGLHANDLNGFHAGFSFKSTQYFRDFEFDPGARQFRFNLDYPMILSAGVGYSGFERVELAADVRYIDFANTDGFDTTGFDESGAVVGFGWNSILAAAVGVQYEVTERLPVRFGYAFNENPIDDAMAFYNVASPAIVQHHISGGLSYRFTPTVALAVAVQYAPGTEVESPMHNPQMIPMTGTSMMPGTTVSSELSTLTGVLGLNVKL